MKIEMNWQSEGSSLLLRDIGKEMYEILDYRWDYKEIHKICGGQLTYVSKSGLTGKGFIKEYENLIPIGSYRVDTGTMNSFDRIEYTSGTYILFPRNGAVKPSLGLLKKFPVVIVIKSEIIIYCKFRNLNKILQELNNDTILKENKFTIVTRKLVNVKKCKLEDVTTKFVNTFGKINHLSWSVWDFYWNDEYVPEIQDRLCEIFWKGVLPSGKYVSTTRCGDKIYAKEILLDDPFDDPNQILKQGWKRATARVHYKIENNRAYVVAWRKRKNRDGYTVIEQLIDAEAIQKSPFEISRALEVQLRFLSQF